MWCAKSVPVPRWQGEGGSEGGEGAEMSSWSWPGGRKRSGVTTMRVKRQNYKHVNVDSTCLGMNESAHLMTSASQRVRCTVVSWVLAWLHISVPYVLNAIGFALICATLG